MYKLTLNNPNVVQRLSDGAWIPFADKNADYEDYKRWVAFGNIPQAADPLPVPVKSDLDKTLELLLKSITVAAEDQVLKDELLQKLQD